MLLETQSHVDELLHEIKHETDPSRRNRLIRYINEVPIQFLSIEDFNYCIQWCSSYSILRDLGLKLVRIIRSNRLEELKQNTTSNEPVGTKNPA